MKVAIKNIIKRSFALLLISISLGFVLNQAFFLHTHIDINGEVVQHAHPFKTSEEDANKSNQHTHTVYEILALESLNVLFIVFFCCLLLPFIKEVKISQYKPDISYFKLFVFTPSHRGPPPAL